MRVVPACACTRKRTAAHTLRHEQQHGSSCCCTSMLIVIQCSPPTQRAIGKPLHLLHWHSSRRPRALRPTTCSPRRRAGCSPPAEQIVGPVQVPVAAARQPLGAPLGAWRRPPPPASRRRRRRRRRSGGGGGGGGGSRRRGGAIKKLSAILFVGGCREASTKGSLFSVVRAKIGVRFLKNRTPQPLCGVAKNGSDSQDHEQ